LGGLLFGVSRAIAFLFDAASGGLLGALLAPALAQRLPARVVLIAENWVIALTLPLLLPAHNPLVLGAIVAGAVLITAVTNSILVSYQVALVPDRLQGRVQAASTMISSSAGWLGPLVVGLMRLDAGSSATILTLTGWMVLLAIAVISVPAFRHMPGSDDAAVPPANSGGPSSQPDGLQQRLATDFRTAVSRRATARNTALVPARPSGRARRGSLRRHRRSWQPVCCAPWRGTIGMRDAPAMVPRARHRPTPRRKGEPMSRFATVNLLELEDSMGDRAPGIEVRFSRKYLDSRDLGVSHVRYEPNLRAEMAHSHREQEEAYVVVAGSGRVLLDDEVLELRQWDVVRVAPEVVRAFEAGPDGLDLIAVGGPKPEGGDGVLATPSWPS
jgi:mannose-6-phosphate isomerase-like protein (cupin superfamily)